MTAYMSDPSNLVLSEHRSRKLIARRTRHFSTWSKFIEGKSRRCEPQPLLLAPVAAEPYRRRGLQTGCPHALDLRHQRPTAPYTGAAPLGITPKCCTMCASRLGDLPHLACRLDLEDNPRCLSMKPLMTQPDGPPGNPGAVQSSSQKPVFYPCCTARCAKSEPSACSCRLLQMRATATGPQRRRRP